MTQTDTDRIQRLLKLADIAQEFEFVDLKLVNHFSYLREEYGLAKLLLLIKEHATTKSEVRAQTSETQNSNQNLTPLQRM